MDGTGSQFISHSTLYDGQTVTLQIPRAVFSKKRYRFKGLTPTTFEESGVPAVTPNGTRVSGDSECYEVTKREGNLKTRFVIRGQFVKFYVFRGPESDVTKVLTEKSAIRPLERGGLSFYVGTKHNEYKVMSFDDAFDHLYILAHDVELKDLRRRSPFDVIVASNLFAIIKSIINLLTD